MLNRLIIGSSHVLNFLPWIDGNELSHKYSFKSLRDFVYDSRIATLQNESYDLIEPAENWFSENIEKFDEIYLSISGSDYLPYCISNREVFDFIIPFEEFYLDKKARIIPYDELWCALHDEIKYIEYALKAVLKHKKTGLFYLESPPPLEDNEHIIKNSKWASESINKYGVSSPHIRLKMWVLHSKLVKSFCVNTGFTFIDVPAILKNKNGYLNENAYKDDFFHANDWYGRIFLQLIDKNSF
jgi:hypothetical protein